MVTDVSLVDLWSLRCLWHKENLSGQLVGSREGKRAGGQLGTFSSLAVSLSREAVPVRKSRGLQMERGESQHGRSRWEKQPGDRRRRLQAGRGGGSLGVGELQVDAVGRWFCC